MFVGVVALCCVVLITECHNSHTHSQSPVTRLGQALVFGQTVIIIYLKKAHYSEKTSYANFKIFNFFYKLRCRHLFNKSIVWFSKRNTAMSHVHNLSMFLSLY